MLCLLPGRLLVFQLLAVLLQLLPVPALRFTPLAPKDQRHDEQQGAQRPLHGLVACDPIAEFGKSDADPCNHFSTFVAFFSPHQRIASPAIITAKPV